MIGSSVRLFERDRAAGAAAEGKLPTADQLKFASGE